MSEREALDKILALKPEDFETPELIAETYHNIGKMVWLHEGIQAVLYRVQTIALETDCASRDMKSALEELVAWQESPALRGEVESSEEFTEWAYKIWGTAKTLLRWN